MSKTVIRNERRIQILEALHRCLLKKPFYQTTIKDIAIQAGINHGLLHYYFENKQDILLKYIDFTFENYYEEFLKRFTSRDGTAAPSPEKIDEQFHWMMHEVAFNREYARIFTEIWALSFHNEAIRQKLHELYSKWKDRIVGLMETSRENRQAASRISLTMIAITEGLSLFSALFSKNDLCTDIHFSDLIKNLEHPGEKPCGSEAIFHVAKR